MNDNQNPETNLIIVKNVANRESVENPFSFITQSQTT
jgi:hypothetical protein